MFDGLPVTSTSSYLIDQGGNNRQGVFIIFGQSPKFGLNLPTKAYVCPQEVVAHMQPNIYNKWIFIGITYNPYSDKVFCAINEEFGEAPYSTKTEGGNKDARFFSPRNFMIDELVYAPVNLDKERMAILYNQSEYSI